MARISVVLFLVLSAHVWAQEPTGDEFKMNSYSLGLQVAPSVAACASGHFVATWNSEAQDGEEEAVIARLYGPGGQPTSPELAANSYTVRSQAHPAVACRPSGEFVIVWQSLGQDGDNWGVYGRRFDAQGRPRSPEFRVNQHTVDNQGDPRVAMDASGNFVVVWQSLHQDGSDWGVFGRRYLESGIARGSEFRVNEETAGSQTEPALAGDPAGGFVVTWSSWKQDGQDWGVFARRYAPSGQPLGHEFQVNTTTAHIQDRPSVAYEGPNGFVVAWEGLGPYGGDLDVFAQRYHPDGVPAGPEFVVHAESFEFQMDPAATRRPQGSLVMWTSREQDGSRDGVFGQRLTPEGVKEGPEFQANTTSLGQQDAPAVAVDADGNIFVAWEGEEGTDGLDYGVFGRTYEFTYDLGDAPAPYPTLRTRDGARHRQPSALYLGAGVSSEWEGKPGPLADQDDDDGIAFAQPLTVGGSSSVEITASGSGRLSAWIDWNRDGDWDDRGEEVLADVEVVAGGNALPIEVPLTARTGLTMARFRLSSSGGLASRGFATDGEVEDLQVAIQPVGMSISDATVVEGDSGTRLALFTVEMAALSPSVVRVEYSTAPETAEDASDFLGRSGRLSFPPGTTKRTISIPVLSDFAIEPDERFRVELTGATNATLLDPTGLGTITNDDGPGIFQLTDSSYSVGEGAVELVLGVERSGGVGDAVDVAYATDPGSADAVDYVPTSGVLSFEGGGVRKTFSVRILADQVPEGPESFLVRLHSPTAGAELGPRSTAVVTIVDDDLAPMVQFAATSFRAFEKKRLCVVSVTRSRNLRGTASVDYATRDGSAQSPADYAATSGTLTFTDGMSHLAFVVRIVDDQLAEGPETAQVVLTNPVGALLGARASSQLEIVDARGALQGSALEYVAGEAPGLPGPP